MAVRYGDLYRAGHERVVALVRGLPATTLSDPVPACPGWSVHDVVAHLAGLAVDATSGRLSGIPDDAWTAGQVRDRAGHDLETLVAEWSGAVDAVVSALDERTMAPNISMDVLCHEADLVEALGAPAPPADGWTPAARQVATRAIGSLPGALTVGTPEAEFGTEARDGSPTTVEVTTYELWRALFSRRSRAQIQAWDWSGDPTPWVDRLGVFGPREDDQPRPPAAGSDGREPSTPAG